MEKVIYLQKIGDIDQIILKRLKQDLESALKGYIKSVVILPNEIPLSDSDYIPTRKQYNASLIKEKLKRYVKKEKLFRILGVMNKDIFSKKKAFLYGIATRPKKQFLKFSVAALISITRLREEYYRRFKSKALFKSRVLKEAIHELGHTFRLKHCTNKCVMQHSIFLGDIDKKPHIFCEACSKKLKKLFNKLK